MSEVQEPITMLRLTATRFFALSFAPNDKLVCAGMNIWGFEIVEMAEFRAMLWVFYVFPLIDWLFQQRLKPKVFLFLLEIRICMVTRTMEFSLTLFLRDKFVVRRLLKTLRKNRNCSLAPESIHLAAVSHTADGCVNNIKFASYLTENLPLTCKRIPKRQRPSNTRTIFHVIHLKAWIRDSRKEKPYTS